MPIARRDVVCGTALAAAALVVYVLRFNDAVGLMVDDAYYVVLARALADGEGYRLISSGTTAMLPLYPPGFPAILSIAFQLVPAFPQNVWLLKSASIAAMIGVGFLTYKYLRQRRMERELAACVAVAVTVTPAFVFVATSTVMSECVFTLTQLATVVCIHRSLDSSNGRVGLRLTVASALLAATTMLIRSAGVGLVAATGLWLLKERQWKRAALYGAVVALCVVPWLTYARAHEPTRAERLEHGGSIVYSYGEQIWMRWAGDPASGTVSIRDVPARVFTNVVDVFGRGMGGIFLPSLFRGPDESGEEMVALGGAAGLSQGSMGSAGATMVIALCLSFLVLIGLIRAARERVTVAELLVPIALLIIFGWPFWTFRFVLPLTPFLFFYLVSGIETLTLWMRPVGRGSALYALRVNRVALLCVIGLNLTDHAGYIFEARNAKSSEHISWLVQARETNEALEWMNRNLDAGIVATTNPALVYLRTGRKTLSFDRPLVESWRTWKQRGVRYVACLLAVQMPPDSGEFKVLYRSPGGFWIIEI